MFKNHFKTAWRSLSKNKTFTAINIFGLTAGLCACMLVATVIMDDLSYDKQWTRSNDLYRIVSVNKMGEGLYDRSTHSFVGLAHTLRTDYPEVEAATQLYAYQQRLKLSDKDPNGVEIHALRMDTSAWRMLDTKVIVGNPYHYIAGTKNLVITEGFRKQYFPDENPVGKVVTDVPTYGEKVSYQITGVIKDLPSNTVFRTDILIVGEGSTETLNNEGYGTLQQQFILLKNGSNPAQLAAKLNKWYAGFTTNKRITQFEFQPLKDVYLHSDFAESQNVKGDYKNVYIFSGVALLLLLIACVNFVNLNTAKAIDRAKETGIRKVLGAGRRQLIWQFLTESFLLFGAATVLSTFFYFLSLRPLEMFLQHPLQRDVFLQWHVFTAMLGFIFIISLLAGFYPAWILSGFKPVTTLKGKLFLGNMSVQNLIRKALVVVQFSISIAVVIALIVVQQQVSYMKNKDIGYDENNLMSIDFISWDGKADAFKNEVLSLPGVQSASISDWIPTEGAGSMSTEVDDPQHPGNKLTVWSINADVDFATTMRFHLQKGRLLNRSFPSDMVSPDSLMQLTPEQYKAVAYKQPTLLTAYTAKALHVSGLNAISGAGINTPVGILSDFNNESLKDPMKPTVIVADKSPQYGGMLVRVRPGSEQAAMASINKLWRTFYPEKLLNIQWVDDMLKSQYKEEDKLEQLFLFFSGLSLLLAALGIFGLIVQATHQRIKEIGIRKVLGASVQSIVSLFSTDFIKLVMLAVFLASPIAAWLMSHWLQSFAYRISISWWMFAIAGILTVVIALLTISFQSVKAAVANPVKSLRTE